MVKYKKCAYLKIKADKWLLWQFSKFARNGTKLWWVGQGRVMREKWGQLSLNNNKKKVYNTKKRRRQVCISFLNFSLYFFITIYTLICPPPSTTSLFSMPMSPSLFLLNPSTPSPPPLSCHLLSTSLSLVCLLDQFVH